MQVVASMNCTGVILVYFAFFLTNESYNLLSFKNFFVRDVKFVNGTNKYLSYTELNISINSEAKLLNLYHKAKLVGVMPFLIQ